MSSYTRTLDNAVCRYFGMDVCEDDEDEGEDMFVGAVGYIEGFRFIRSCPEAAFAVEADIPERPKQIVHGPQRKGRGGKIKRW